MKCGARHLAPHPSLKTDLGPNQVLILDREVTEVVPLIRSKKRRLKYQMANSLALEETKIPDL